MKTPAIKLSNDTWYPGCPGGASANGVSSAPTATAAAGMLPRPARYSAAIGTSARGSGTTCERMSWPGFTETDSAARLWCSSSASASLKVANSIAS